MFIAHPHIHMLKPSTQCDNLWRWGLWEMIGSGGGTLMNGISDLIKELPFPLVTRGEGRR